MGYFESLPAMRRGLTPAIEQALRQDEESRKMRDFLAGCKVLPKAGSNSPAGAARRSMSTWRKKPSTFLEDHGGVAAATSGRCSSKKPQLYGKLQFQAETTKKSKMLILHMRQKRKSFSKHKQF